MMTNEVKERMICHHSSSLPSHCYNRKWSNPTDFVQCKCTWLRVAAHMACKWTANGSWFDEMISLIISHESPRCPSVPTVGRDRTISHWQRATLHFPVRPSASWYKRDNTEAKLYPPWGRNWRKRPRPGARNWYPIGKDLTWRRSWASRVHQEDRGLASRGRFSGFEGPFCKRNHRCPIKEWNLQLQHVVVGLIFPITESPRHQPAACHKPCSSAMSFKLWLDMMMIFELWLWLVTRRERPTSWERQHRPPAAVQSAILPTSTPVRRNLPT